ncbi:MAG: SGNH/GDSL hydrolase family protein [Lachnospiraceae bacterium]|nr:SGNH/GDSL hydrolase family protein [Lachnospiraceae bacterium]
MLTALVITVVVIGSLWLLQRLLVPKYMTGIVEGAMIAEYYEEEKDHDVIFIGDCEVYENFIPAVLWEEYGIHSFIRGSAQQLIWQSYYLLEETLKYETPEVVVFNILSMKYNTPQKEAYNRMTIDGMKWSASKIGSIKASMTKDEQFLDYVFPILRYHTRITELNRDDFKYLFHRDKVTFNGYYMRVDVKPAEDVPTGRPLADYTFGETAYEYLDKITAICKEKGVQLVLIKAPSLYPYWYDEWEVQMEEYAKKHNLVYINFLELIEECGLDFSTDTYDAGLHLNLSGAQKASKWFGKFLVENCGLTSRRGDEKLEVLWKDKLAAYEAEIKRQTEAVSKE